MSENVSTQLPNPPELHPLPSHQNKMWQIASYLLIAGGLGLAAWGGWLFYQNQVEAAKPPPARIVEVSPADLQTPTPRPTPSPTPTPLAATALPTAAAVVQPVADQPAAEAEAPPVGQAEAKIEEELRLSRQIAAGPEPTATAVLSLEDNPLVVEEEPPLPAGEPVEAGPPTRIVAESIGLDSPVVEVGWKQVVQNGVSTNVWVVAEYAAGWHKNSALPGQGGNIVLSGHHNIKGEVFRYIVDLEPGAVISLYMGNRRYDYVVDDKFIVKDKGEPEEVRIANARWIGPFNEERLTLVTCWPYNNNTHRVIVIAKPA